MFVSVMGRRTGRWRGSLAGLERLAVQESGKLSSTFNSVGRIDTCLIAPIGLIGVQGLRPESWEGYRCGMSRWARIFWAVLASVIIDRSWRRPPQRSQ